MPTLAIDAACLADLWKMDRVANAENSPMLSGCEIKDIQEKGGKIYFDLGDVTVVSDPDDMYAFDKNNHFTLREDL